MGLFDFKQKEKPDIPKDAPKKKGIKLVLSTIWREFFNLLKLNLIFLLAALPIVTIPAALKAMSRITIAMVRDENYFIWRDFWEAFKDDFWKSFFGGLILFVACLMFALSIIVYGYLGREVHWLLLALAAFSIVLLLWAYMASFYFYPMNAYVSLKFRALLRNSVFLVFVGWKRSGLALLSALIFLGVPIALMPYSAVFLFFFSIPFTHLLVTFAVYPVIEKRTAILEAEEGVVTEEDEKYLNPKTFKGWENEEEEIHSATLSGWDDEPEEAEPKTEEKPEEAPGEDASKIEEKETPKDAE